MAGQVSGCERDPANVQCCVDAGSGAPVPTSPPGNIPSSGVITPCQVAQLLRNNGVAEQYINRLVCTAKYESGFNCGAQNLANSDGSGDYGIYICCLRIVRHR